MNFAGLEDHIHETEAPAVLPQVQFKDQSVGVRSVQYLGEVPPSIPRIMASRASSRLVSIPLTPPLHSSLRATLFESFEF